MEGISPSDISSNKCKGRKITAIIRVHAGSRLDKTSANKGNDFGSDERSREGFLIPQKRNFQSGDGTAQELTTAVQGTKIALKRRETREKVVIVVLLQNKSIQSLARLGRILHQRGRRNKMRKR